MDQASAGPPPVPPRRTRKPRETRSFWRSPLGCVVAILIGAVGLVVAGIIAVALAVQFGFLPDTEALPGSRIPTRVVGILQDNEIVAVDEEVMFFYSAAVTDFLEDGNLFTDRRVVSYWNYGEGLEVESAAYPEIEDITAEWSEDWLEDTEIVIHLEDGAVFNLVVSNENRGDRKFFDKLRETWEERR